MNAIKALIKLVPPPAHPMDLGSASDWGRVEKELGAKLPKDYKAFVKHYGTGEFANFFVVFNPFTPSGSNLLTNFRQRGENYRERHAEDSENYPLPVFPEVPGLIPWGCDSNGHTYFWLVKDAKQPDEWTVVWDDLDGPEGFEENDYTLSSYLLAVLNGEIDALAGNYPGDEDFIFKPSKPSAVDPRVVELATAIRAGDAASVTALVEAGVDIDAAAPDDFPPIVIASHQNSDMIKLVLSLGADPRRAQTEEYSPLAGPVFGNDYEGVQALIDAGCDVNATWERWGHNALNQAYDEKMIRLLLKAGCQPIGADYSQGRTPLYYAIESGNADLVKLLIEHGADVNAKVLPKKKTSPLSFAKEFKRTEIVKILKSAGAKL